MADTMKFDDISDRGSPQYVAWMLLYGIAMHEEKTYGGTVKADKEWVLRTYEQCLTVTTRGSAENTLKSR